MTFAVFSLHVKASEYVDGGFRIVPGGNVIPAVPLFTAESFEEAEAERLDRLGRARQP